MILTFSYKILAKAKARNQAEEELRIYLDCLRKKERVLILSSKIPSLFSLIGIERGKDK